MPASVRRLAHSGYSHIAIPYRHGGSKCPRSLDEGLKGPATVRSKYKVCVHGRTHLLSDDPPCIDIKEAVSGLPRTENERNDESHIQPALPGRNISEVLNPRVD